jgi:hypothetical protein
MLVKSDFSANLYLKLPTVITLFIAVKYEILAIITTDLMHICS